MSAIFDNLGTVEIVWILVVAGYVGFLLGEVLRFYAPIVWRKLERPRAAAVFVLILAASWIFPLHHCRRCEDGFIELFDSMADHVPPYLLRMISAGLSFLPEWT